MLQRGDPLNVAIRHGISLFQHPLLNKEMLESVLRLGEFLAAWWKCWVRQMDVAEEDDTARPSNTAWPAPWPAPRPGIYCDRRPAPASLTGQCSW